MLDTQHYGNELDAIPLLRSGDKLRPTLRSGQPRHEYLPRHSIIDWAVPCTPCKQYVRLPRAQHALYQHQLQEWVRKTGR